VLGLADVVHFVEDGHVVASGTHAELVTSNKNYRSLVSRGAWETELEEASY
jgi:ABC-type multidrug transport system fused ATPase/permease subunit